MGSCLKIRPHPPTVFLYTKRDKIFSRHFMRRFKKGFKALHGTGGFELIIDFTKRFNMNPCSCRADSPHFKIEILAYSWNHKNLMETN